jgi:hypothetical protein
VIGLSALCTRQQKMRFRLGFGVDA